MNLLKTATSIGLCALLSFALAPSALADEWNRKTIVTFSGPVEIPGVHLVGWGVLPAGTYVFKILDSLSDRHIVQIFSKDEKTIYATILAIPNYRIRATDKTVMTFSERPAGQPEALRAWFYPGRNSGEEFVYPKAKAVALAKATNVPVLFTTAELPQETTERIASADAPIVTELKKATIMGIQPTGEEVELAQVVTPPPAEAPVTLAAAAEQPAAPAAPAATQTAEAETARLPDTASDVPLTGLVGVLMLGGAYAVRRIARRLA
jgi:hypothetical protein